MPKGFIELTAFDGHARALIPIDRIASITETGGVTYLALRELTSLTRLIDTYDEVKAKIIEAQR